MKVLPEGEYFVGTRGGGMDHAAVLASEAGCALLIRSFEPLVVESVRIPSDWAFLVAHSLTAAEKSGSLREEYNSRRTAGARAIEKLKLGSYREAVGRHSFDELRTMATGRLDDEEMRCFLHVTGEAFRVHEAVTAMQNRDAATFGRLLDASHESLRDLLRVSCPSLDAVVDAARGAGAFGARLTGAGFGGFAVIACYAADRERVAERLIDRFYSGRNGFVRERHLINVEPSAGALHR
jgi:galactokinase